MDLRHLLMSSESSSEQEPGKWREVLHKRKGINFSTTTSEGRLLRSSQVNAKRTNDRQQIVAERRNLAEKEEKEGKEKEGSKKATKDSKPGEEGGGKGAKTRKEKLKEFLENKRIIEEAKKRKAKPAFRAGKVQHSWSTWSGPVSQACSMSQSMMSAEVFKKPPTGGTKGKLARSSSTMSLVRNETAHKNQTSGSKQKSFAPCNYKFNLQVKSKNLNGAKTTSKEVTKVTKEVTKSAKQVTKPEVTKVTKQEKAKEASKEVASRVKSEVKEIPQEGEVKSEVKEIPQEVEVVKCQQFRELLKSETERITALCENWENLIKSKEDLADDVAGEVRSVVGLGRLVMAERFSQFSGLIDNCQFRKGEKETKAEDLQGFWEMINLQVQDVDKKFVALKKLKENNWVRLQAKKLGTEGMKPRRPKNVSARPVSQAQASSGLKALIAARRKAAIKPLGEVPEVQRTAEGGDNPIQQLEKPDQETWRVSSEALLEVESPMMTFDGGFFQVTSPCSRMPKAKSSAVKLRQAASNNNASASKPSSQLLSPFTTALAKLTLDSGSKSMRLFTEGDVEEEINPADHLETPEQVEDPVTVVCPDVAKKPSLTPESCVDLMSFDSPVSSKKL